jgi:hypothetical protein
MEALKRFARDLLTYGSGGQARFEFRPYRCPACGALQFAVTIITHSGSKPGNFRGEIMGRCLACGEMARLFSFTGPNRHPLLQRQLACRACGRTQFSLAECERFEGDFFDEGVVVGRCAGCDVLQEVVAYD